VKTTHIIILVIILLTFGIILTTVVNTKTYSSFSEAIAKEGTEVSIIGKPDVRGDLDSIRALFPFTFWMTDNTGSSMQVIYQGTMPRDFEKLDQIVVVGTARNDIFEARELVLKCPSKYEESLPERQ